MIISSEENIYKSVKHDTRLLLLHKDFDPQTKFVYTYPRTFFAYDLLVPSQMLESVCFRRDLVAYDLNATVYFGLLIFS